MDVPVLGVVFNPATGECFEAERGCGAWCGATPLRVSTHDALARRAPAVEPHRDAPAQLADSHAGGHLHRPELARYKLALVAAGRFDGLISRRACHDWDFAAAQLLVAEAGGRLTAADGGALVLNQPDPVTPASRRRAPIACIERCSSGWRSA